MASKNNAPAPTPTDVELLKARIAELEKRNSTLEAKVEKQQTIGFKVSPKKALSMYGLGRFPVTLYKSQWETLLKNAPAIEKALKTHTAELATKEN